MVAHVPAGSHGVENLFRCERRGAGGRHAIGLFRQVHGHAFLAAADGDAAAAAGRRRIGGGRNGHGRLPVAADAAGLHAAPGRAGADRGLLGGSDGHCRFAAIAVESHRGRIDRQFDLCDILADRDHQALLVADDTDGTRSDGGPGVRRCRDFHDQQLIEFVLDFVKADPGVGATDSGLDAAVDGQFDGSAFCGKVQFRRRGGQLDGLGFGLLTAGEGKGQGGQKCQGNLQVFHNRSYFHSKGSAATSFQSDSMARASKPTGAFPRSGTLKERSIVS